MLPEVLIKLARVSPKEFAATILKRNESLMERLVMLQPYIGRTFGDVPDSVITPALETTFIGCPHCSGDCTACLWTTVVDAGRSHACTGVEFDTDDCGLRLDRICVLKHISVSYYTKSECLWLGGGCSPHSVSADAEVSAGDYELCRKFIQAHIDWAKLDCWGSDLEVPVEQQTKKDE